MELEGNFRNNTKQTYHDERVLHQGWQVIECVGHALDPAGEGDAELAVCDRLFHGVVVLGAVHDVLGTLAGTLAVPVNHKLKWVGV